MRTKLITVTITIALLTGGAACSSTGDQPDHAACKAAMTKAFDDAMAAGEQAEESERPAACNGIDDKSLERLVSDVTTEYIEGEQAAEDLQDDLDAIEDDIDATIDDLGVSPTP